MSSAECTCRSELLAMKISPNLRPRSKLAMSPTWKGALSSSAANLARASASMSHERSTPRTRDAVGGDGQEHAARSTGQLEHGPPGGCGQVEVKAYVGADPARLRIHEVVQASVRVQALDHNFVPIRRTGVLSHQCSLSRIRTSVDGFVVPCL